MSEPVEIRQRRRVSLATALTGAVSLLIVAAVGGVLYVSLGSGRANTFALLLDKTDLAMQLLETRIRGQLDPVMGSATEIGEMIASGRLRPTNRPAMVATLSGALAAIPQATGLVFLDPNGPGTAVARLDGEIRPRPLPPPPQAGQGLDQARNADGPFWSPPVWVRGLRTAAINVVVPVHRDGAFVGVIGALVTLADMNEFLQALRRKEGLTAFILYDGTTVLAHPDLTEYEPVARGSGESPLPDLVTADPELKLLETTHTHPQGIPAAFGEAFSTIRMDDDHIVLMREITGFGSRPWQLGLRFDRAELTREVERIQLAGGIGLAILVLALVLAQLWGRAVARRIRLLAVTAASLTTLDVANTKPLPDSRIRELASAARAFNALIRAMRWFESYVPQRLVVDLMSRGDRAIASEERELTIMFTDIRGFSALAEDKRPAEIAGILNRHFAMLTGCIEAEGGTVDKFIGDSLMAFWGAPEPMTDHRVRALRAAVAIQQAVTEQRRRDDADDVAVRVGIHTGPVVVGNIGAPSRVNYTVVGDPVNMASRLQELAKEIAPDDDCVVLISEATAAGAPEAMTLTSVGIRAIKGRRGTINAYRLA